MNILYYRYREWGWQLFEAFENDTKVDTGEYCSLDEGTIRFSNSRFWPSWFFFACPCFSEK